MYHIVWSIDIEFNFWSRVRVTKTELGHIFLLWPQGFYKLWKMNSNTSTYFLDLLWLIIINTVMTHSLTISPPATLQPRSSLTAWSNLLSRIPTVWPEGKFDKRKAFMSSWTRPYIIYYISYISNIRLTFGNIVHIVKSISSRSKRFECNKTTCLAINTCND